MCSVDTGRADAGLCLGLVECGVMISWVRVCGILCVRVSMIPPTRRLSVVVDQRGQQAHTLGSLVVSVGSVGSEE